MDPMLLTVALGGVLLGALVGAGIWQAMVSAKGRNARQLVAAAEADAEGIRRAAASEGAAERTAERERLLVEARGEALALKEEASRDAARRREEVERSERRVAEREAQAAEREERLRTEQRTVDEQRLRLETEQRSLAGRVEALAAREAEIRTALERVAGLTAEAAAREIRQQVEDEARTAAAAIARDIKEKAKRDADREGRRLIAMAAQRLAAEHTAETTVSTVALPNDEMKGRIIGREGRNIRAFELSTGVDVIIDDTPDTVVISCFDPIRREVARRALEALVTDGRIHPGRIEEVVGKMRGELDNQLVELGERAAFEVGVHGLHPELLRLVGRMRYRTSYGQNLYEHSKEVAWLAGMMAAELHADVNLARRGGLLHDVGKVLTHEHEGTHVQLGVEMAKKYGEHPLVINAIEAHHDDVPHETTESVLVQAADAISGARPGARREAFETYVKRLARLEELAGGHDGVEKVTVIQAGREVRVIVQPEKVDDGKAQALSETIARQIEQELQYPGQIRVTVIRETRATDVAK